MLFSPAFAVVTLALAGVTAPNNAAQELLDKLAKAADEQEAGLLEEEIWDTWMVSGSPTVDILMKRGVEALDHQDLQLARDMFDRVILIKPDYAEGWNRRALLFFNEGKYDEAIRDLDAALNREPRHFGAWIGLGMIFESMSQPSAALKAYREALKIHPFAKAAKAGEKRLVTAVEGKPL